MHRTTAPGCLVKFSFLFLMLASGASAQVQLQPLAMEIPMRDGTSLAADIYHNGGSKAKPVVLVQTPYNRLLYRARLGRTGSTFPLDTARYHYAFVDWRGFFGSTDAAVPGYDRGLDGYDAVEWIAAQQWCNGKVATYGGSALGKIQFQTARHKPPHLVCAMPMIIDYRTDYSDYYYGGVLRREHVEALEGLGFMTVEQITRQPVETPFWDTVRRNTDYAEDIAVPVLMVSGWFDHYPTDVLRAFTDLQERSAAPVRDAHRLIMGPWLHGGVDLEKQGHLTFPGTAMVARDAALRFFDYHLNGAKNGWPLTAGIRYYQMGMNEWQAISTWEMWDTGESALYLHADGRLDHHTAPLPASGRTVPYDPRDPSPSHGGARFNPFDPSLEIGPIDIRDVVERRDDVLIYTSDSLTRPVWFSGSLRFECSFSADRPDTDIALRLCDVHPDGRSIILTDGIHRARFRGGTNREDLLASDERTSLTMELQEIVHVFLPGHRIRVVISGSNYPRFDLNPNSGAALYEPGDTLVANITIYSGGEGGSRLVFDGGFTLDAPALPAASTGVHIHSITPQPYRSGVSGGLTVSFSTSPAGSGDAEIAVFDLFGRRFRSEHIPARGGEQQWTWDARMQSGSIPASGTYLIVLQQGDSRAVRPVLLVR